MLTPADSVGQASSTTARPAAAAAAPVAGRRRRRRRWLALPLAAGLGALLALTGMSAFRHGRQTTFTHTGPTVTELEKLGHLCTLRVHVADVLQLDDQRWYGHIRGAWIVKGDALIAVDMRQARIIEKDPERRQAVILLPTPALLSPRVDHERTRTYDYDIGLFRDPGYAQQLRDQAMLEAQKLVTFAAQRETRDLSGVARRQAEDIIRRFYDLVGWTVEIRWADAPASRAAR